MDVGSGSGTLLKYICENDSTNIANVYAVDLCEEMVDIVEEKFPDVNTLLADYLELSKSSLPNMQKGVDVIFLNSVISTFTDLKDPLNVSAALLNPGGRLIISHPLGSPFVSEMKKSMEELYLNDLPAVEELKLLVKHLPLKVDKFVSEDELYIARLVQRPYHALEKVLCMRGNVASGWGRGGKKLGIPTANLPESMFADALRDVPTGVYLGWAQIDGVSSKSVKAVVNVGYSPTFVGAENREKVVEAHLLEKFQDDFYGKEMRLMLAGFLRPETKFDSFPELLAAIHKVFPLCTVLGLSKLSTFPPGYREFKRSPGYRGVFDSLLPSLSASNSLLLLSVRVNSHLTAGHVDRKNAKAKHGSRL
eukprot:768633-Hanusia_phi.AAC.1